MNSEPQPSFTLMGVLNCTPDSFYDGSDDSIDFRFKKALSLISEGASIIDIGGESSRPGSDPVPEKEELNRVIPVIEKISSETNITISIDTTKSSVANAALKAGASIINDISAGSDPKMLYVALEHSAKVIHMHMQGKPKSMQVNPQYKNVVTDILAELSQKRDEWLKAGFSKENIWWDPGIGFGKSLEHNLDIMAHLSEFTQKAEIVLGVSRKSYIAKIDSQSKSPDDRLAGSLAPLSYAWDAGVRIFRVHDVAATQQFLKVHCAIGNSKNDSLRC